MSDTERRTVEDYLAVFHEDNGLMTPVTLTAYATSNPSVEFIEAALLAMDDAECGVRVWGARYLGIARTSPQSNVIPESVWGRGQDCLIARLKDSDEHVQVEAAIALGRLAPTSVSAQAVIPVLAAIVQNPERSDRVMRGVAYAISLFASAIPDEVIRVAPTLLQNEDSEVVCFGLLSLGQCGELATSFLPQISRLGRSRDADIRHCANETLQRLGHSPRISWWTAISRLFRRRD